VGALYLPGISTLRPFASEPVLTMDKNFPFVADSKKHVFASANKSGISSAILTAWQYSDCGSY
jgi:hypothetical protein